MALFAGGVLFLIRAPRGRNKYFYGQPDFLPNNRKK
jgi:hypothetical protein